MTGSGFPVVNDPDPQPNDCDPQTPCMAYIAALDNTGSILRYARLLGHGRGDSLGFGPNGDVYIAGNSYGGYFPRTFDAFQYCSNPPPVAFTYLTSSIVSPNQFVMRLNFDGERKFSSFLGTGGAVAGHVSHLQFAGSDALYVAGYSYPLVGGGAGYFVAAIDTTQAPRIPHACLVNATQNVGDSDGQYLYVAPGQMVTLFGEGLGPETPAPAEWNAEGSLSNSLAGVQVLFDGIPAPLLYAQANQVNCIVPFGIASNQSTSVIVQYAGSQTDPLVFHVASDVANPFTKDYLPGADVVAINQDGTMNSSDHPAPRGSIITFFVTGLGQTIPPLQDGQIAPGAAPATTGIRVYFFGPSTDRLGPAEVLYQGAAPGQVAGVYQLNVRIPANATTGHTQVQFGGLSVVTESIWLQ